MLQKVVPHFLARCPVCRERYEEIQLLLLESGHWDEEVALHEGTQAPELFHRLTRHSLDEQVRLIEEDEELHTWGLCQLLLQTSLVTIRDEPAKSLDLAEAAVRVSRHLGDAYDRNWVLDLRARAYAYLGNARRVLGELKSAEAAFRKAEGYLQRSTSGNLRIEAEVLDLRSSLRRDQRLFDEGVRLADRALDLYRQCNDLHGTGKMLLKRAKILEDAGDHDRAIALLREAPTEIDHESEPQLFACARYNLLGTFSLAGRYEEADRLLPEVRDLFKSTAQPLDLVRLRWAEGSIDLGLGRIEHAEAAFREVQQEFLRQEMAYNAALVSLDLAALYAQEGRTGDLKLIAAELVPVFESRDIHREALAAFLLFRQACEEERLTAEMARRLATLLDKKGWRAGVGTE
ncbi:MAG TPA: hypothetical protein VE685_01140 [Thermoanaerobaculia bacterium]|nr:hypothetical protein [Thermoanaerobaculia bacterium]